MQLTNRLQTATSDAAVFSYAGKLILQGLLPYRDFWDNKPPLIFYTQALGFLLSPHGLWGPLLLQTAAFLATESLIFFFARQALPDEKWARRAAFLLATLGLTNPFLTENAHLTET